MCLAEWEEGVVNIKITINAKKVNVYLGGPGKAGEEEVGVADAVSIEDIGGWGFTYDDGYLPDECPPEYPNECPVEDDE